MVFIAYGLTPNAPIGFLFQLVAIDIGVSILLLFIYPYMRGVKKGDKLLVVDEKTPFLFMGLPFSNAIATTDGKINDLVQFELAGNRGIGIGLIVKYEGILSNAEVKKMQTSLPIEMTQKPITQ